MCVFIIFVVLIGLCFQKLCQFNSTTAATGILWMANFNCRAY